jgi:outer membrane protein assembly factor BamE
MIKCFARAIALSLVVAFALGCVRVYVPDVQQGNVITQEMVNQLKVGMNRRQVQFILGTPLIMDPFHQDRWDYYYSLKRGKKYRAKRTLSLFFKGDELTEIRGNVRVKPQGTSEIKTKPAGSS